MNCSRIVTVYFSPTHTSRRIAREVARGTGLGLLTEIDLTCDPGCDPIALPQDALILLAAPVYGGRVAPTALERLARLRGQGQAAVALVVYGNRDYEDALLELSDRAKDWGLIPVAAGAFIGEHSYSRPSLPVAEGRPDEDDLKRCRDFAAAVMEKLHRCGSLEQACDFPVKGSRPYKALKPSTPQAPITLPEKCLRCGSCLEHCPTLAIFRAADGSVDTDMGRCIKCCACVKGCPAQARVFDTPFSEFLHTHFSARREPEVFL